MKSVLLLLFSTVAAVQVIKKGSDNELREAYTDECVDHAQSVALATPTPDGFRTVASDMCSSEFQKIVSRVALEVRTSEYEAIQEWASSAADGICQAALGDIAAETSMDTMARTYCESLADELISNIDKLELTEVQRRLKVTTGSGSESMYNCFPEDAMVKVKTDDGVHSVRMGDLRRGDYIQSAVMSSGDTFFTEVLTDLHTEEEHNTKNLHFLMLSYAGGGSLNLTADHFVATRDRGFVPASFVKVGDELLIEAKGELVATIVDKISHVTKHGMYAPLTWNGGLLVNGVLTSSYVAPPHTWASQVAWATAVSYLGWDGLHRLGHMCMLPIRVAHASGFVRIVERFSFIPGANSLSCFVSPCQENIPANPTGWALPRYVDWAGSLVGSVFAWLPVYSVVGSDVRQWTCESGQK